MEQIKMPKRYPVTKTTHGFNDHVSGHGKTLKNKGNEFFGNVFSLLDQATNCKDPQKQLQIAKQLGDMNLSSVNYLELAPAAKQAILNYIQATEQYNTDTKDIALASGKSATMINKAKQQTQLANSEYINRRSESLLDYNNASTYERQRHTGEMAYLSLQGRIKLAMGRIDVTNRLSIAAVQPQIANIKEQLNYQKQATVAYLSEGSNSTIDLIPRKDYTPVAQKSQNFLSKMAEKVGLYL